MLQNNIIHHIFLAYFSLKKIKVIKKSLYKIIQKGRRGWELGSPVLLAGEGGRWGLRGLRPLWRLMAGPPSQLGLLQAVVRAREGCGLGVFRLGRGAVGPICFGRGRRTSGQPQGRSPSPRCSASPAAYWAPGPAAVPQSAHRSPCALGTGPHSSPAL